MINYKLNDCIKKNTQMGVLSLFVVIALLYLTGTDYILKAVRVVYLNGETTASIDDHIYFENSVIKSGASNAWPKHKNYNNLYTSEKLTYLHERE